MPRPLLLACLLLALAAPPALADVTACAFGDKACASAWSAKTGSCGGAGSERNVVRLSARDLGALDVELGDVDVFIETLCVRVNGESYREVRVDASAAGTRTYLGWYNDNGACSMLLHTEGTPAGTQQRRAACASATPPAVPALLA